MTTATTFTSPIMSPWLYASNCLLSRTSNTVLSVGEGQVRDVTNSIDAIIDDAIAINLALNGAGGLDTGTIAASTQYFAYLLIDQSYENLPSATASLSASAPLLPKGYTTSVLIGSFYMDGSTHVQIFTYSGVGVTRTVMFDEPIVALNAQGGTSFDDVVLVGVPSTADLAIVQLTMVPNTAGNAATIRPTGSAGAGQMTMVGSVASQPNTAQYTVQVGTASSVDWKTASASDDLTIAVIGYIENLQSV